MSQPPAASPLQSLPPGLAVGARVMARGWRWRLGRAERGTSCVGWQVTCRQRGAPAIDALLHPFDPLVFDAGSPAWRHLSRAALRQHIAQIGGAWPDQPLAALQTLKTAPWPHQLTLALALVEGRGTRLVLADAVGLGKTLTAALALAELRERGVGSHVLALVPAGLRDQWRQELDARAGITAEVIDATALAERRRRSLSPQAAWAAPGTFILSVDFAKQPTVTVGLLSRTWDALVVDEAHLASGDTARRAVVAELAARSRIVLLISATPHTGDPEHFRALMGMGGNDDVVWISRDRRAIGIRSTARTRRWRVACSGAELRLLRALTRYARDVDRHGGAEARLVAVVLRKRALSSPDALRVTLRRRRLLLKNDGDVQIALPFEGSAGETDLEDVHDDVALGVPGLANHAAELERLEGLEALCGLAARGWSKAATLDRLLRRTREPVIVFTEYRDTLLALLDRLAGRASIALLHGGLDRRTRAQAVASFTGGATRVLLATDAAAEGLNLQARCRLVVNVELPWSPLRLEQRAGRVDRIGQSRPVRVWTLAGRSGHEDMVVASLARRAAAIGSDLASLQGSASGHDVIGARAVGRRRDRHARRARPRQAACARAPASDGGQSPPGIGGIDLEPRARHATARRGDIRAGGGARRGGSPARGGAGGSAFASGWVAQALASGDCTRRRSLGARGLSPRDRDGLGAGSARAAPRTVHDGRTRPAGRTMAAIVLRSPARPCARGAQERPRSASRIARGARAGTCRRGRRRARRRPGNREPPVIPAIEGGLLTQDFLEAGLASIFTEATSPCPSGLARTYDRLRSTAGAELGPASPARAVADIAVRPLMEWLGWAVSRAGARTADDWWAALTSPSSDAVGLLVSPWASSLSTRARAAAAAALAHGLRWSLVCNGRSVRIVDATRSTADAGLEFDSSSSVVPTQSR